MWVAARSRSAVLRRRSEHVGTSRRRREAGRRRPSVARWTSHAVRRTTTVGGRERRLAASVPAVTTAPLMGLSQLRFERDSSTLRARHATTRYEVFRALAYEIDSSTPRELVVGVSGMLIDSSMHTILTLYLYRPTLHRVCEYARNCLY